jgi:hypothetical protein
MFQKQCIDVGGVYDRFESVRVDDVVAGVEEVMC